MVVLMVLLMLLVLVPVLEGVSAPPVQPSAAVEDLSVLEILQRDRNHAPTRYFSRSP